MASPSTDSPKQNHLLASLSAEALARLQDDLELVPLQRGQILHEPGDSLSHIHFPTTCVVSLIFSARNGASAEVAMTGNDGLIGTEMALGSDIATQRAIVQNSGNAYRLRAKAMRWEVDQDSELRHRALRYTQALMTQMGQSIVCNRHHSIEQQLCRWLLLSQDRLPGRQISMTQEQIGNMLGVRRAAITEASGKLQAAGLIRYSRGQIAITNRPGLEARACECYSATKSERDQRQKLKLDVRTRTQGKSDPESLRQLAETHLRMAQATPPNGAEDEARLLHELQVHKIELEMQNEELRRAYAEAEEQRKRSADIYDFAPMGYFTLDPLTTIVDLNLAGASLLNIERAQKSRHRFAAFVTPDYQPIFKRFVEEVLNAEGKRICEIALTAVGQRPTGLVRIEAVADESGRECRMVVIDIYTERLAEKALFEREHYQRALLDNFGASSARHG